MQAGQPDLLAQGDLQKAESLGSGMLVNFRSFSIVFMSIALPSAQNWAQPNPATGDPLDGTIRPKSTRCGNLWHTTDSDGWRVAWLQVLHPGAGGAGGRLTRHLGLPWYRFRGPEGFFDVSLGMG